MNDTDIARECASTMYANDRASQALGIRVTVTRPGHAEASMEIRDDMLNGHDVCHGGIVFALADTAFAFACNGYDRLTLAAGAAIDFMHAGKQGDRLTAVAAERHRGGRSGVYDVLVSNQDDVQIAVFRGRSHTTSKPILG